MEKVFAVWMAFWALSVIVVIYFIKRNKKKNLDKISITLGLIVAISLLAILIYAIINFDFSGIIK